MLRVTVTKSKRCLSIFRQEKQIFSCRVALGRQPAGAKEREGDGRTPEGIYRICLIKECGKYGRSLGLSYPSAEDAEAALSEGRIGHSAYEAIVNAHRDLRRPPWGTPLGGEVYIHEGGSASDWTQGCIALNSADMDILWPLREEISEIIITP